MEEIRFSFSSLDGVKGDCGPCATADSQVPTASYPPSVGVGAGVQVVVVAVIQLIWHCKALFLRKAMLHILSFPLIEVAGVREQVGEVPGACTHTHTHTRTHARSTHARTQVGEVPRAQGGACSKAYARATSNNRGVGRSDGHASWRSQRQSPRSLRQQFAAG